MRGRKPKPTAAKVLAGNPGRRPLNPSEPAYPAGAGEPPAHFSEEARAEWDRVSRIMIASRVLTEADRAVLALYCSVWSKWVKADAMVARTGEVLKARDGGLYQNPYLAVANRALEQLARLAAQLGLDPTARPRVVALPKPSDKPKTRPQTHLDRLGQAGCFPAGS